MSEKYKIQDIGKAYFVIITVTGWIDVFTRKNQLGYIHNNPVEELIVPKPEDYIFSSARNYAGLDNILDVCLISKQWETYS